MQLRSACQYVTDQGRPHMHRADPGVDDRQVDADAQQVAVCGGDLHEAAGASVGDTQRGPQVAHTAAKHHRCRRSARGIP